MTAHFDYTNKSVIVTGGTRGIGKRIAEGFLSAGAKVLVCGRKEPETLPQAGGNTAHFVAADVREVADIDKVVSESIQRHGSLDVLVNNAGGSPYAEAATASPRFSSAIINLNLVAPLNFSQRANAQMQEQSSGGVIVNIASVSARRPSPGTAAYGAAKAGLLNLTQTLAVEWAPKVRVVAVTAGLIKTELAHMHYGDEDGVKALAATVPLERLGSPEDVANAVLFLASSQAAFVSGTSLAVHGGGERPAFLEALKKRE